MPRPHASARKQTPDEQQALAEQGDVEAQYSLGIDYDIGSGVQQDEAEAARWYRLAADQGHVGAQFMRPT